MAARLAGSPPRASQVTIITPYDPQPGSSAPSCTTRDRPRREGRHRAPFQVDALEQGSLVVLEDVWLGIQRLPIGGVG